MATLMPNEQRQADGGGIRRSRIGKNRSRLRDPGADGARFDSREESCISARQITVPLHTRQTSAYHGRDADMKPRPHQLLHSRSCCC